MRNVAIGLGALVALTSGASLEGNKRAPLIARQSANPDSDSFVRRADAAATILGDYLYIVGGGVSQHLDGKDDEDANVSGVNATLSISLKQNWDPREVKYNVIKANDFPTAIGHALWSDEKDNEVLFWGGRDFDSDGVGSGNPRLWRLKADGNGKGSWSSEKPPNSIKRTAFGAETTCAGRGWMVGGHGEKDTDQSTYSETRIAVPGLISYDFADDKFSNQTTKGLTDSGNFQKGSAVCVEMKGQKPKLFVIGGAETKDTNVVDSESTNISFDYAHFWDPEESKWYRQETQGTRPPARQGLCAVGAQGPNNTYEIFMYSGFQNGGLLGDVWVLSIPAFRWFKADTQNSSDRLSAACVRHGSQMIAVGGNGGPIWQAEDPFPQGLGILDLNELQWKDEFKANPDKYEGPSMVREWYRERGHDTIPWESDEVKSFFLTSSDDTKDNDGSNSDSPDSPSPTSDSDSSQSNDDKTDDEDDSSNNTPAIVGGVVGGVVALAVVALAGWMYRRRQTEARQGSIIHEADEAYAMHKPPPSASYGASYAGSSPTPNSSYGTQQGSIRATEASEMVGSPARHSATMSEVGSPVILQSATAVPLRIQRHGERAEMDAGDGREHAVELP